MALNEYLIDKSEYLKRLRSNLEEMETQLRADLVKAITSYEIEVEERDKLVEILLEIGRNNRKEQ